MHYQYCKLHERQIRALHLQPGIGTDALWASFETIDLAPLEISNVRLSMDELEQTIPKDWKVYETLERRYLFDHLWDGEDGSTTWEHPNSQLDPKLYSVPLPDDSDLPSESYFEALSYTWGTEEVSENLHIFETDVTAILQIRRNLAAALCRLRKNEGVRILWVDALCINQSDGKERDQQVALMADIYRSATKVIVWLGEEQANSTLALRTLDYLGKQVEVSRADALLRSPGCEELSWYRTRFEMPYTAVTWTAIDHLINRNWFERLWIWQEVHLANLRVMVQCGAEVVPFYTLRRALICLREKQKLPSALFRNRLEFVDRLLRDRSGLDFPGLLSVTRLHKATNPKDRIYGVLGLAQFASLRIASMIRPNYSLDMEDIYRGAFESYLEDSKLLTLLRDCNLEQRRMGGPTWVPDWSNPRPCNPLNYYLLASGNSEAIYNLDESHILRVAGINIDTIVSVEQSTSSTDDFMTTVLNMLSSTESKLKEQMREKDYINVSLITLCAGQIKETCPQIPAPTLAQCRHSYEKMKDGLGAHQNSTDYIANDIFLSKAHFWSQGRVVFQSRNNIGLGPSGVKQGDIVCAFFGCNVPIILRPTTEGRYQVVGEAYLYGYMNSEAFLGQLDDGWQVQVRKEGKREGYFFPAYYNTRDRKGPTTLDPRLRNVILESTGAVLKETVYDAAVRRGVSLQDFDLE